MTVSREQLEACLDKVRERVRDPREGLYGPSSMVWRINRERLLFLSGTRAVLLQEAHPFVAHGVDQYSQTKRDPIGRFARTFKHVHAMLFGDLESAVTSARRVHKYHMAIRGTITENTGAYMQGAAYEANDEQALLWVHATIWESSVTAYEIFFRPLSASEKERFYQETKLFAYMFGIPDSIIPPTWSDFVEYNERMWQSNVLAVESTARSMADFILSPTNPFHQRFAGLNRSITAALLPARFRAPYGLVYGGRERVVFEAAVRAFRVSAALLPRQYRYVPAYLEARARIGREVVPTLPERIVTRLGFLGAEKHAT